MNYNPKNPESRRLRRFAIGNDTLTAILRGQVEIVPGQFPEDAEITWVGSDLLTRCGVIYVWSSEFYVVSDGNVIPDCGLIKLRSVPKDEVKPGESWRERPSLL